MEDRIRSALAAALAAANIPGAVAAVGNSAGTLCEVAVGHKGPGGPPLAQDALFQIASMTKAVTTVAAMQLVEQGRLALDADIAAVLPELASPQVLAAFDDAGQPITRAAAGPITLRHLLTHTSGLGYEFMSGELAKWRIKNPAAQASLASLSMPLLGDPGTLWVYGVSSDWAGLAVERASGLTLDDYFAQHVTGPLQMTDTSFAFDDAIKARLTPLHLRLPDGNLTAIPVHFGGGAAAEFRSGGAGLIGTASDYLRFARMILKGGTLDAARVLQDETVAQMGRNQVPMAAGRLTIDMMGAASTVDLFPGMDCGFGLGFLINPQPGPDGRAAGSLTWSGIANSYYWIDPANDIAAVLCMQHLPFAEPAALAVLQAFERAVYGQ